MRVALITRLGLEGDWEYALNIVNNIKEDHKDIELEVFEHDNRPDVMRDRIAHCDIAHINFVYGMSWGHPGNISKLNKKVVLTFHESNPQDNASTHMFLRAASAVIVHEKNNHGFIHIPQGIPVVNPCEWSATNDAIGTGGFPFADKNLEAITGAGAMLAASLDPERFNTMHIVSPASGHANTIVMGDRLTSIWLRTCPHKGFFYYTEFYPQDKVLSILSKNLVNVFAPNSRRLGPSGSVRLGLATGSHIVLNRSAMFRDLFEYEDEIEFIEGNPNQTSPEDIARAVQRVVANGKRPKRVLEDGSWKRCTELYANVYRSLK